MKVFYSDDFPGHWPVGTSAVVVAEDEQQARHLISEELKNHGLSFEGCTLEEVDTATAHAIIIQDGEY
jgi:hypothetical protein